jgi:hypothetical protein
MTRNGHHCNVTSGSSRIIHNHEVGTEPMLKLKVTEETILPGKIGTTLTTNCMDILQKQDTLMAKNNPYLRDTDKRFCKELQ